LLFIPHPYEGKRPMFPELLGAPLLFPVKNEIDNPPPKSLSPFLITCAWEKLINRLK
jgi:hypothetical protein